MVKNLLLELFYHHRTLIVLIQSDSSVQNEVKRSGSRAKQTCRNLYSFYAVLTRNESPAYCK